MDVSQRCPHSTIAGGLRRFGFARVHERDVRVKARGDRFSLRETRGLRVAPVARRRSEVFR